MYTEFPHDINRPADPFEDWAMSLDAYLDTPAGLRWLAEQGDVADMQRAAERYGSRPGIWEAAP
ncbi:hypothetical protein [Thiobaca trueperi]|uniref:Uncharacterized protein n=1 Tax=Thiobaca trueperi TaxID=127458 RepID=A0A4R3MX71_9GAMM|nr:hypothetical protein [Thiobaca trueperi]TCT21188.1 hypothetical protein EDC35_10441 [Thiobaca trueperi]